MQNGDNGHARMEYEQYLDICETQFVLDISSCI